MSLSEYDELTPHELNLHIQAYNEKLTRESKERITAAYLVAGWSRTKKLPDLKKILGEDRRNEQTEKQMLNTVKMLNAAFGGVVKKDG